MTSRGGGGGVAGAAWTGLGISTTDWVAQLAWAGFGEYYNRWCSQDGRSHRVAYEIDGCLHFNTNCTSFDLCKKHGIE